MEKINLLIGFFLRIVEDLNIKTLLFAFLLFGFCLPFRMDEYDCEEYSYDECELIDHCEWNDEDEDCISEEDSNNDDDDDDDDYEDGENYLFRAHAEFEIGSEETNDEMHFGKVKTKIDSHNINSIEFDLKNLQPNFNYYLEFSNFWTYDILTDSTGNFEWTISTDGLENQLLPPEICPVSDLAGVGLFNEFGVLLAFSLFELDDDGCDDLPQLVCEAIPLCTWDNDGECEENEWDIDDEDEEWDEGEFYSDELLELYTEYMNYYNSSGEGIFNFITIDATNTASRADIGDEIGLLDYQGIINSGSCEEIYGETITASGVWDGAPITLFAYGNLNVCEENGFILPGFVSGNQIIMRIWKPGLGIYFDIELGINWGDNQTMSTVTVNIPSLDLNQDASLDVIDVIQMVQIVLENIPNDINADINNDNIVNIFDILKVIEIIMNQ
jgi:hypothetical protein